MRRNGSCGRYSPMAKDRRIRARACIKLAISPSAIICAQMLPSAEASTGPALTGNWQAFAHS